MNYKLIKDFDGVERGAVLRTDANGIKSVISASSDNADWQAYQEWLALGNTPEEA